VLLQGFPEDLLDSYPVLKGFRNTVALVPKIAAYYSTATDDVRAKGFKPKP
jgi:glutathione S-transferase